MIEVNVQDFMGRRVLVSGGGTQAVGILVAVRQVDGGAAGDMWFDMLDGYTMLGTAPEFSIVLFPSGGEDV